MGNPNASFSAKVKAGRNTYYVDVKETKKQDLYLSITENQYDGKENKKTTIRVFGKAIEELRGVINDACSSIAGS
jgi:hypothetical protein